MFGLGVDGVGEVEVEGTEGGEGGWGILEGFSLEGGGADEEFDFIFVLFDNFVVVVGGVVVEVEVFFGSEVEFGF